MPFFIKFAFPFFLFLSIFTVVNGQGEITVAILGGISRKQIHGKKLATVEEKSLKGQTDTWYYSKLFIKYAGRR